MFGGCRRLRKEATLRSVKIPRLHRQLLAEPDPAEALRLDVHHLARALDLPLHQQGQCGARDPAVCRSAQDTRAWPRLSHNRRGAWLISGQASTRRDRDRYGGVRRGGGGALSKVPTERKP